MNTFVRPETPEQLAMVRTLFREYAAELGVDLCFQRFEEELKELPGKYSPPGGDLILACCDNEAAGCVAVRELAAGVCEMKRLYVRPAYRHTGLGRRLAEHILVVAQRLGYQRMALDTLESLVPALRLYESLGFRGTEPYYPNPLAGVVYLSLDLGLSAANHCQEHS